MNISNNNLDKRENLNEFNNNESKNINNITNKPFKYILFLIKIFKYIHVKQLVFQL